ncbi:hypothetical protein G6F37_001417 [Rhizopus arrhizus]|nr:hypothetical protein G6F38_000636 [Rhizopus arrhizus]KAG1163226.1 hypothetical protein G6F37_001417 [Rhizopus arrhizus]
MYKRKQTGSSESATQKKSKSEVEEIWHKVFSDAQEAYKQSKFEDATALFTRALGMQPDQVTILDCRAACFEKLKDYSSALSDAKRIITVAPRDARGYLRAGKILSLQKKFKGAMKAYDLGLEKVSREDKRYDLISTMKKSAERAIAVGIDFMMVLPYDIKAMIFSYLSFDRRVQCMAVCRSWYAFATSWSGMWRELDFENKKINGQIVKRYMTYAQGRHVRRLTLSDAEQNLMEKVLKLVISEDCQYLERLDLKACHPPPALFLRTLRLMGKNLVDLNLDDTWGIGIHDIFDHVLKYCTKLKRLSILKINSVIEEDRSFDERVQERKVYKTDLIELRMNLESEQVSDNSLFKLLSYFPNLRLLQLTIRTMDIHRFYHALHVHCPKLESVILNFHHIQPNPMDALPNIKLSLRHIHLRTVSLTSANLIQHNFLSSNSLQTIAIANYTGLGPLLSKMALTGLSELQTLYLTSTLDLDQEDLITLLSACPRLEDLKITQSQGVTDAVLASFPNQNQLKRLDVSQSRHLTGLGLKKVVESQRGSLQKLVINNCHRIQADAVAWATEQLGRRVVECRHTVNKR